MWHWILISVCFILLTLVFLEIDFRAKYHKLDTVPGPKGIPILRNALQVGTNPVDFLAKSFQHTKDYGKVLKLLIAYRPCIFISDVNLLEKLLSSPKYIQKSFDYDRLHNFLGQGLLTATGQHWKTHRKLLTPAFHFKLLESSIEAFQTIGEVLLEKLSECCDKGVVDIYPFISRYTLDVICETSMGANLNCLNNYETNDYFHSIKIVCQLMMERVFNPLKQYELVYKMSSDYKKELDCVKILHKFSNEIIAKRKAARSKFNEENGKRDFENEDEEDEGIIINKKRVCFLDILLDTSIDGKPLSDEEIREEVDTFMFAGHDTTAAGTSFTLYELAQNPDIQQKVFEEVSQVFGDEKYKILSLKELNELKYVEMVAKESLRKYPPVPYVARQLLEDVHFGDMIIPKGTAVNPFLFALHRDPEIYPDPERFDPDRFLPENIRTRHPFAYLPFSAGPRNCIGQKFAMLELKAIISRIVYNFEFSTAGPEYKPILAGEATTRSNNGINIKIKKRQI